MPQQVSRLAIVFALAVTALIVGRKMLIPDTFGDLGHFRAAAIDSVAKHQKKYAGQEECVVCHFDVQEVREAGHHRTVSCEVCHGPAAQHAASPMDTKPVINRERELCTLCHGYSTARPTGFPQIEEILHNPRTPCITCHQPHAPEPPVAPGECSACHGQIARQKAVSPHANLSCSTCHQAPEEHKHTPAAALPTKPQARSFCGGCHATGKETPGGPPQIDLQTHEPRYLCWQCHYPHLPSTG